MAQARTTGDPRHIHGAQGTDSGNIGGERASSGHNISGTDITGHGFDAGGSAPSESRIDAPVIDGNKYLVRPLNTFDQFEVARKLSPVLALLSSQKDKKKLSEAFPQAFCSLTAHLHKSDIEDIFKLAFSTVSRIQQNQAVPIYTAGQLAFSDIGMKAMLTLLWSVLEVNRLVDFFNGSPSVLDGVLK
jgi:hypothetical protein